MANVIINDETFENIDEVYLKKSDDSGDELFVLPVDPPVIRQKEIIANGTYTVPDGVDGYNPIIVNVPSEAPETQEKTVSPTTSKQDVTPDSGKLLSKVTVNAMPTGTAGTPVATKGAVSNHIITITPSVVNSTGYITGDTKTGTPVEVSASELVSGSETKTQNGTYDVTNLAEFVVNVSGGGGTSVLTATGNFTSDAAGAYVTVQCIDDTTHASFVPDVVYVYPRNVTLPNGVSHLYTEYGVQYPNPLAFDMRSIGVIGQSASITAGNMAGELNADYVLYVGYCKKNTSVGGFDVGSIYWQALNGAWGYTSFTYDYKAIKYT